MVRSPTHRLDSDSARPVRLADEVHTLLYGKLMARKIPPGGRISVDSLVRELGVSQTPIREALSRLEAQGLVVKTHLVGYSAAPEIDEDRLEQLYDLRILLEPFAARQAALNIDDAGIAALKALTDDMDRASAGGRGTYDQFARLDSEFHSLISLTCGNDLVHESLQGLHTHVHLFRRVYHAQATSDAIAEHAAITAALVAHAPDEAEAAMRAHIQRSKERYLPAQ